MTTLRSFLLSSFTLFLLGCPLTLAQSFSLNQISDRFPSEGFEPQVKFWRAVFTQYGEKDVVLHDKNDLRLIYEVVRFTQGTNRGKSETKRQRRKLRIRKNQLAAAMDSLRIRSIDSKKMDKTQQRILTVIRAVNLEPSPLLFKKLRNNIHAQRGLKENFQKGIIRAGLYLRDMKATFDRHGLPTELALLPHVESSFNFASRSRKGAAGIWQFMRRTARGYNLRVNRSIDQRLDPLAATDAAARYLKDSYRKLGNWPLAITSYNHGQQGIARAKRRHGSDLLTIISKYQSRSFGYASRNFYAEFLAAVEVSKNYRSYWGQLAISEPLEYGEVFLKKAVRLRSLTRIEGLSQQVLRKYNPQVNNYVWTRSKIFPRGFKIRVPRAKIKMVRLALVAAPRPGRISASAKSSPNGYLVQWGDSLIQIARRYDTSVKAIQRVNNLKRHRIYAGQVLKIPGAPPVSAKKKDLGQKGLAKTRSEVGSPTPAIRRRYRVKRGDSLSTIAERFGTSVSEVQSTNSIRNHRIYIGQIVIIPGAFKASQRYRVRRGDTLSTIAHQFRISVKKLTVRNDLEDPDQIYPGQFLMIR